LETEFFLNPKFQTVKIDSIRKKHLIYYLLWFWNTLRLSVKSFVYLLHCLQNSSFNCWQSTDSIQKWAQNIFSPFFRILVSSLEWSSHMVRTCWTVEHQMKRFYQRVVTVLLMSFYDARSSASQSTTFIRVKWSILVYSCSHSHAYAYTRELVQQVFQIYTFGSVEKRQSRFSYKEIKFIFCKSYSWDVIWSNLRLLHLGEFLLQWQHSLKAKFLLALYIPILNYQCLILNGGIYTADEKIFWVDKQFR